MSECPIELRESVFDDAKLIFDWRNDPLTREASFSNDEIPWEDHIKWFEQSLANPCRKIYIGENKQEKISFGQVRFDLISDLEAEISIVIAPEFRSKGLGSILIKSGMEKFCSTHPGIKTIVAMIKPSNPASKRAFQKCGFNCQKSELLKKNILAERWILKVT